MDPEYQENTNNADNHGDAQQPEQTKKGTQSQSSHSRKSSQVSEGKEGGLLANDTGISKEQLKNTGENPSQLSELLIVDPQQGHHHQQQQAVKADSSNLPHLGDTYQIGPLDPQATKEFPSELYVSKYHQDPNPYQMPKDQQDEQNRPSESEIIHIMVQPQETQKAEEYVHAEQLHEQTQGQQQIQHQQQHQVQEHSQQEQQVRQHSHDKQQQLQIPSEIHTQPQQPYENNPPEIQQIEQNQVLAEVQNHEAPQPIQESQPIHIAQPQPTRIPIEQHLDDQRQQQHRSQREEDNNSPLVVPQQQKVSISLALDDNPGQSTERSHNKIDKVTDGHEEEKLLRDEKQELIKKSYVEIKQPKSRTGAQKKGSEGETCQCSMM